MFVEPCDGAYRGGPACGEVRRVADRFVFAAKNHALGQMGWNFSFRKQKVRHESVVSHGLSQSLTTRLLVATASEF